MLQNNIYFQRQIQLPNFGLQKQKLLADAKVLVVGAGGLGCPVLQYLINAGVGNIGIVEFDIISYSNLHRQFLYAVSDVGDLKLNALKRRFNNASTNIEYFNETLNVQNIQRIFANYDIIADTTDNFATRYLINDACVIMDKTLVSASIYQYQGQLAVFNMPLNLERSATYRCLFPDAPTQALNCSEAGVLATVTGVLGTMQAHEIIKVIVNANDILFNKLLILDTQNWHQQLINYNRDELAIQQLKSNGFYSNYDLVCDSKDFNIPQITIAELNQWKANGINFLLIDVRTEAEHQQFNIGGTNIPLEDFSELKKVISNSIPTVLYCQVGERSSIAIQRLSQHYSIHNVFNLNGGLQRI